MKIVRLLGTLLVACCIGTTISLVVVGGMLWFKGALGGDRVMGMLAALYGIDTSRVAPAAAAKETNGEQPSLDDLLQKRLLASLDLDLRESAVDKSLGDLRNIETQIKTESQRLDAWKLSFDKRLQELETKAADAALQEIQQTLEVMNPKQAKDQIIRVLEAPPVIEQDRPLQDVVSILTTMPLDKRKKILSEFKSPQEMETLAVILREIRLGMPDSEIIRSTRSQLQDQLNPQR
jgi:hypothetical protein